MSLTQNFLSLIIASTTAFTSSITGIEMKDPIPIVDDYAQQAVEKASEKGSTSSMVAGVTILDRAKRNSMKTNGTLAHTQFDMQSLGRLPILFYSILKDDEVAKGNVTEIVSMMQGFSGSATDSMWEKYGGKSIITDLSQKYNLQETTAGESWYDTKMSAVDITRLYRRFLDDNDVSNDEKRWAMSMIAGTSMSVSGQDFSWGLPSSVSSLEDNVSSDGSNTDDKKTNLSWVQGWSEAGVDPVIRSSTGVFGTDMRYIIVIHGKFPSSISDDVANKTLTEMSDLIIQNINDEISEEEDDDSDANKFYREQQKKFGSYVGEPLDGEGTENSNSNDTSNRGSSEQSSEYSSTKIPSSSEKTSTSTKKKRM